MLQSLSDSFKGNNRFKQNNLFYHKGGFLYSVGKDGNLSKQKDHTWVGMLPPYSVSQNVALSKTALGTNGCDDCHSEKSRIFKAAVVTNLIGEKGETVYVKSGTFLGYSSATIIMSQLYGSFLNIVAFFLTFIFIVVFFLMLQYGYSTPQRIQSVAWLTEHRGYLLRIVITLFFIFLGHIFIFIKSGMINVFFSLYKKAAVYAGVEGLVFLIIGIITFFLWTKNVKLTINKNHWLSRLIPDDSVLSSRLINISAAFVAISGMVLLINIKYKLMAAVIFVTSIIHGLAATFFLFILLFNIALKLCEDRS